MRTRLTHRNNPISLIEIRVPRTVHDAKPGRFRADMDSLGGARTNPRRATRTGGSFGSATTRDFGRREEIGSAPGATATSRSRLRSSDTGIDRCGGGAGKDRVSGRTWAFPRRFYTFQRPKVKQDRFASDPVGRVTVSVTGPELSVSPNVTNIEGEFTRCHGTKFVGS